MKKAMLAIVQMVMVVAVLGVGAVGAGAQDSVPAAINFQGELYDPSASGGSGGPMTGVQQVEFRVYDNLTGGTLIWGRSFPVFCNNQGVFNVMLNDSGTWLGGVTNTLRAAFQGASRYLEMTVTGHGSAIAPRQQFVSAPYAMHSAYSTYADIAPAGFEVDNGLHVVSGGAEITGQGTFHNNLVVSGSVSANSLAVTAGATVGGNLAVATPSVISGYGTIPIGCIVMWSGAQAAIPDGWSLCDGGNYNGHVTPDLRDRFIVGAGSAYGVGSSGGANTVTLTTDQMPNHSHTPYAPNYDGGGSSSQGYAANNVHNSFRSSDRSRDYALNSGAISSTGGGQAHENRPPYYALCFIMRTK